MKEEQLEEIAKMFLNKPKKGFILLPSVDGFDVFEFDEMELRAMMFAKAELINSAFNSDGSYSPHKDINLINSIIKQS